MGIPSATEILDLLMKAKPRPTSEASRDARGIYGLFEHAGTFRYIGSTLSAAENLLQAHPPASLHRVVKLQLLFLGDVQHRTHVAPAQ